METLLIIVNWLLPLLYMALLIDYGATFFLRIKTEHHRLWLISVIVIHTAFMVLRAFHLGHPPLIGVYEHLSVLALATAIVYGLVEWKTRDRRSGMFVFLLVFLFQYTSSIFTANTAAIQTNWARLHILPAVLADTAITLAAVYGLLHLLARRNLKQHHIGLLFDRLPPVELLGRMTWYALLVGFAFLTISMATGPLTARHGSVPTVYTAKLVAKIVFGCLAWLVCITAVLGRAAGKWAASRISGLAVTAFVIVVVMLIVSAVLS